MIIEYYINKTYKYLIGKNSISLLIIFALCLTSINCYASDIEYEQTNEVSLDKLTQDHQVWKVKAFQAKKSMSCDDEVSPAKICFTNGAFKECFEAIATVDDNPYNFQSVKELSIVELFKDKSPLNLILFVSEYCGGCAESLRLISIWAYRTDTTKFENLAPTITITEQGEYKFLTRKDGLEGFFVTADYILGDNETLFAPHKYRIKLFTYNASTNSFILANEYITKRLYGFDNAGMINVIAPELPDIKKAAYMGK